MKHLALQFLNSHSVISFVLFVWVSYPCIGEPELLIVAWNQGKTGLGDEVRPYRNTLRVNGVFSKTPSQFSKETFMKVRKTLNYFYKEFF